MPGRASRVDGFDEAPGPDPYLRVDETFPVLDDAELASIARFGTVERVASGELLFERGQRGVDFFAVVSGWIEICERTADGGRRVIHVHRERQFTGEIDLFTDREILVDGRMGADGEVIRVRRTAFRRLLAAEPELARLIMRAFIFRRSGFITHDEAAVVVTGDARDDRTRQVRRFLQRNGHPSVFMDVADVAAAGSLPADDLPHVSASGTVLRRPTIRELADHLGLVEPLPVGSCDVAVVGAGPAGLAAAVYAASEGLTTFVVEQLAPGGQAGTSSRIENYLGFPIGLSGESLAARAQVQAQRFGATIGVARAARQLEGTAPPYRLVLDDGDVLEARTVVIATGATYRTLAGVHDIERFEGLGVHYAATAIEAELCRGEEVVIVGAGNSAGQAAVFLSGFARRVHVVARGDDIRSSMSEYLVERLHALARVELHTASNVVAVEGTSRLERVTVAGRTGRRDVASSNLFLMLGAVPNTGWLPPAVRTDDDGFVVTTSSTGAEPGRLFETSLPGVFAVGDVRSGSVKRVASAVGEGSIVVSAIHGVLAAQATAPR